MPFGKNKRWGSSWPGAVERVLGGWEVAGFMRVTSGRPFTVYSGSNTFSNVVQSAANCSGCKPGEGTPFEDAGTGYIWFFNQGQRAAFSTPAPGQMGNTGRNGFLGPHYFESDMALLKHIRLKGERWQMELRADATNLTNSVSFDYPTATITSSIFGRIKDSTTTGSRKIQLGAKLYF